MFLQNFVEFVERYYPIELENDKEEFIVDFADLIKFDPDTADQLVENPQYIKELEKEVSELAIVPKNLRFKNIDNKKLIREIRAKDQNNLINVEGVVKKASTVYPKLKIAVWECLRCGEIEEIEQHGNKIVDPHECEGCERKNCFDLVENDSEYEDFQLLQVQEPHELLSGSKQPTDIEIEVWGLETGKTEAGERISVNGIVKSKKYKKKSNIFKKYIKNLYIQRKQESITEIEIEQEDLSRIKELKNNQSTFEKIWRSISPEIKGYENVKKAIALQLFSGSGSGKRRGDIHILLVGDPSVGKSEILGHVDEISPKSVSASGKASTGAGLTAAATRSEWEGEGWTIEAGALPLADQGVAIIDEIDKMNPQDRDSIHEAMEQQKISIAKAGISTTLMSRCSVLAAGNPQDGRFDRHQYVHEQIDLDPALLSRFDLIFTLTDEQDEEKDKKIAEHITQVHEDKISQKVDKDLLRKYISKSKQIKPTMTKEAKQKMVEYYVNLRKKSKNGRVPISARKFESLIRLAQASARTEHREEVTSKDTARAIRIVMDSLRETSLDEETGTIDIDITETGTSKSQRDRLRTIRDVINEIDNDTDGRGAEIDKVVNKAAKILKKDEEYIRKEMEKMASKGEIYHPQTNKTVEVL